MASCILHFAYDGEHRNGKSQTGYPILDIWAVAAVKWQGTYTLRRWEEYVRLCREASGAYAVSMRQLDQALWAYGEAHYSRKKHGGECHASPSNKGG